MTELRTIKKKKKRLRASGIFLSTLLSALICIAPAGMSARNAQTGRAGELKIALPANSEVFIDNRRGGVSVEVWEGREVSVSFTGGNSAAGARRKSPVAVERTERVLSVKVAATTTGRVDLSVRVPASARLKVHTSAGELSVTGTPASLIAQTISGDLKLSLTAPPDVALKAQSLNGVLLLGAGVESPGSSPREVNGVFQARWGGGANPVSLFSGRGRVTIIFEERSAQRTPAEFDERRSVVDERGRERSGPVTGSTTRPPQLTGQARTPPAVNVRPPASDEPLEVDEDDVVRVESDLVTVNVNIIERSSGRGVKGLVASDFRIFEDGVAQEIQQFESADAPFDLLLLLDLSGSTARVTDIIRTAAGRFVAATRPQDRVGILAFAGGVSVVSPLTADRRALRAAVARISPPQGDTRLYDSLASAFDFMSRNVDPARRRAVVLMSDGLDSALPNVEGQGSALPYPELLSRTQEFDGVVYTVLTSNEYEAFSPEDIQPETFELAHDRMEELADAGGGIFYPIERLEDLAGAYERVVADLGTVYSLSYRPTNKLRDGSWRTIRVTIPRRPELVARGRRGYFAN